MDILRDGSLDYSDELLAQLDVVVASVHASHRLSAADQTKRVCAALENPHVHILGHPTGRLIGRRRPNPLDMEAVVAKAVETGTALEASCQPHRLDLSDAHVRLAVEAGARLAIDTDAHSVAALDYLPFGVMNARRGWTAAGAMWSTRGRWPELRTLLKYRDGPRCQLPGVDDLAVEHVVSRSRAVTMTTSAQKNWRPRASNTSTTPGEISTSSCRRDFHHDRISSHLFERTGASAGGQRPRR